MGITVHLRVVRIQNLLRGSVRTPAPDSPI
jgi:hypothetical protein